MKRKIPGILLLAVSLTALSGCVKAENAIYAMNNLDIAVGLSDEPHTIDVDARAVTKMVKSGMTFPLYLYSPTCSYCTVSSEILSPYLKSSQKSVYRIEYTASNYAWLNQELPEAFPLELGTPRMIFFQGGELTYECPTNKMISKNGYKSVLNNHFRKSAIFTTTTAEGLSHYLEANEDRNLIYCYSSADENSMSVYFSSVLTKAETSGYPTLLIDFNLLNEVNSSLVRNTLNIDDDEYTSLVVTAGQTKTVIDYSTDDGLTRLNEAVTNYFGS